MPGSSVRTAAKAGLTPSVCFWRDVSLLTGKAEEDYPEEALPEEKNREENIQNYR